MVHRGNSSQYTNINKSDVEKSTPNKKKYSTSSNNNENTDDSDEKSSSQSSPSSSLPILLNGLELRKIDKKIESNEEEEKGRSASLSSYTDNNIMNKYNNNNRNNINNNNKNEKIRLRRNSLLVGNRKLNKISVLVPSSNMILKNRVDNSSGSSNNLSDTNTNGEIECNELVGVVAKLPCSLPLERISGILEKLNIIPKSSDSLSVKSSNSSPDITNGSLSNGNKTMCLYCERTFSCQKLREKHAERVHQATKGRRLSSRTTSATQSAYPGCSFCNVGKISLLLTEDLNDLFSHLIDSHSDKYFACKLCLIRFPSDNTLIAHNQEFHELNNSQTVTRPTSPLNIEIDFENKILTNIISTDTTTVPPPATSNDEEDGGVSNRLRRTSATRKNRQLLKNEELILSRLGVTQNRSPRTKRGPKVRPIGSIETITTNTTVRVVRNSKSGRQTTSTSPIALDTSASVTEVLSNSKQSNTSTNSKNSDSLGTTSFDDDFYETVSLNVRKNLSCHLDGKLDGDPTSPSPVSPVVTEPPLRSTVVRSPHIVDSEIHEATALSAITAFPTLLTAEQYGSEPTTSKLKRTFTKNSWKWKWDFIKKYKYVNEGGKIVKKIKQQTSGFRDLSKLDMWTQLTMRSKHELICRQENVENANNENSTNQIVVASNYLLGIGEVAREEKRKLIDQLNTILDTRQLPQINLEQNDQRVIKQEPGADDETNDFQAGFHDNLLSTEEDMFAKMLKLRRKTFAECNSENRVVLSGEWARPRCYVCFGCGAKFETLKILEEHKNSSHPYVYSTHYEIVGRELIERELYRHFYIPSKALNRHVSYKKSQRIIISSSSTATDGIESRVICLEDSMDSSASGSCSTITKSEICDTDSNSKLSIKLSGSSTVSSIKTSSSSRVPASSSSSSSFTTTTIKKASLKCTKCERECGGTLDLYRHMLDCSSDYAWILAKKRLRYRYFSGNRSRRRRAAGRNNFNSGRPKLMKRQSATSDVEQINTEEDENNTKKNKECITTPRSKPSDAESIERMLANLPAKRTCRQIIPNINLKKTRRVRKIIVPPGLKLSNQNKMSSLQIQRRVTRTNALLTTNQTRNQLQNNRKINLRKRQAPILNTESTETKEKYVTTTIDDSTEDVANLSTSTNDAADTTSEGLDTSESVENEIKPLEDETPQIKPTIKKLKQKTKCKKMVRKLGKQFVGKHRMLRRSSAIMLNASSSSSSETNSPAITKNIMKQISDINSKNEENNDNEVLSTSHQHIKRQFKGNRLMRNNLNFTQTTRNFKLRPARLIIKSHLDDPALEKESKPIEIQEVIVEAMTESEAVKETDEVKVVEDNLQNPKDVDDDTPIDIIVEPVEKEIKVIQDVTPPMPDPTPQETSPILNTQPVVTKVKKKKGRPFKNPKPALTIEEIAVEEKIEEVTKVLQVTEMIESEKPKTDIILDETPVTSDVPSIVSTKSNKPLDETIPKVEEVVTPTLEDHNAQTQKLVGAAKRKPKKLNDCIAMLTGKLQEKLGLPFLKTPPSSLNNDGVALENPESVPEPEVESTKEEVKSDASKEPTTPLCSPTETVKLVVEQEDELVPLDLSIGKTKPDIINHQKEIIDFRTNKPKSIPLNALPLSLIKPIAIDLPKPTSSDKNINLKLSEGTLLNLSPVKPIPHSELPFQAALPSSTLIYPARLSSVPRSNPFNTTNHSITIRPFISHSIPSMLSNSSLIKALGKDNLTVNNKTSITSYSNSSNTQLSTKPSVSVCISSLPPSHNNRTTSVSPPNLSITQIPTGTSISPSNLMHPISGTILSKKPSVTITPSYKQNCGPPSSSISPPLFLFSDAYNRLNESKSSHESSMSIKTFNSLVNNNRTQPEPRRNVMPDKHAINAGLISAMRHKDIDFLKVAELDKIVESINVVKNVEMYETNYKPRRTRKSNNKKLSPMEMVETEMGEDSGDMMGPAPIEPEVIINEDVDGLELTHLNVNNAEEVQSIPFMVSEVVTPPQIKISDEKTIEVSIKETILTKPINDVERETPKDSPEVVNQPLIDEIVTPTEKLDDPPITADLIVEMKIEETPNQNLLTESIVNKSSKNVEKSTEDLQLNKIDVQPIENELKLNEPVVGVKKRAKKSKQITVELEVNEVQADPIVNELIDAETSIVEQPQISNQATEESQSQSVEVNESVSDSIEPEAGVESATKDIEVVKKGKSKRASIKKNKSKLADAPQILDESIKTTCEIETTVTDVASELQTIENSQNEGLNDDTKSQDDSQMSISLHEITQNQEEPSVSDKLKEPQTKPRRKRQSELTAIIADQLLESFKEVDKSRIDELKLLHVLSLDSSQTDDLLLPVVHSTPKRKAAVIKKVDEVKPERPKSSKKPTGKKRSVPVIEQAIETESSIIKENIQVDEPPKTPEPTEEELEQISPKRRSARLTTNVTTPENPTELLITAEITKNIEHLATSIITTPKPSGRIKARRMTIHQTTQLDYEPEERVTVVAKSKEAESIFDKALSDIDDLPLKPAKSVKPISKKAKQSIEQSPFDVENIEPETPETPLRRKSSRNQTKPDDCTKPVEILIRPSSIEPETSEKLETPQKEYQNSSNESDDDLCLAQFAKNAFNKTIESSTREDVISSISDTHPMDAEDDIHNAKRSVEFKLGQNDVQVVNPPQFDDFDDNTNTELVDMDLEDETMSVYTSISIDTSITLNPLGIRKKRKRRSILFKSRKQRGPKFDDSMQEFECELCNKIFRKQESLSKHKMTLTHIAKLSEQEFLNSKNQKAEEQSIISPLRENVTSSPIPVLVETEKPLPPLVTETPNNKLPSITITNSGIEPISSPEHVDVNYDRYSSISPQKENSRFNLSQEEKLFFECCNMLKGSSDQANANLADNNTTHIDSILLNNRKPINKTNGNVQTNLLFSNNQRPSFMSSPKVDPNQFSDISSDSNPAIFHKNKINLNAVENLEPTKSNGIAESIFSQAESLKSSSIIQLQQKQPMIENPPDSEHSTVAPLPENSMLINNYSDLLSDMGDSFPSSQDASESEHYSQTVLERSSLKSDVANDIATRKPSIFDATIIGSEKVNSDVVPFNNTGSEMNSDETKQFDIRTMFESPIHSNSSQSSTTSKLITKGALKGYDNFKVSIPTIGIDLQQALVRSSHVGSKLATLADIALSSDVPATAGLFRDDNIKETESVSFEKTITEEKNQTNPIVESSLSEPLTIKIDSNISLTTQPITPVSPQKLSPKVTDTKPTVRTPSNRRSNGNKLGFKAKKHLKQHAKRNKAKQQRNKNKMSSSEQEKRSIDVYEFEDSFDSVDAPIIPLSKVAGGFRAKLITKEMLELGALACIEDNQSPNSRKDKTGTITEINPPNEESQMSSTSFSDRDDFNFGVDSGVSESSDDSESEHISTSPGLNKLPDTTNNLQKKCLIMGRIFKNAKKTQPQPAEVVASTDGKSLEKINKLPKQELDKLFDSLKEVENKLSAEQSQNENSDLSKLFGESQTKSKKGSKKSDTIGGNRKSKKSREMQMLEVEMGMSLEQIKEIIGVGQRKSQRKCATAKPKILAETWSSDEYEDFHTTKDIIALIQETEIKALQRRNRNKNTNKEKSEANEKNQNTSTNSNDVSGNKELGEDDKLADDDDDDNDEENGEIEDPVPSIAEPALVKATEKIDETENVEYQKSETKLDFAHKDKKENNGNVNNKKSVKIKTPPQRRKSMSANNTAAVKRLVYYDSESDFEADWNRSSKRSKIKKRRKTTAFKEINKVGDRKSPKSSVPPKISKQRATTSDTEMIPAKPNENQQRVKNIKISDDVIVEAEGKESKIPMSRRKRITSEMLYYWSSSSSDDEFGRVGGSSRRNRRNRNRPVEDHHDHLQQDDDEDDDGDDDELTQNGEHLQQHGWIVGDSHKKLVTLLAHAKGKMSDDCGVKESGNKKKS